MVCLAMALWLQNLLVLLAVVASAGFVLCQIVSGLRGRQTRIGSCCAKGCPPQPRPENRVVFMPVEMLARRKR